MEYNHKITRVEGDDVAEETLNEYSSMGYSMLGWKTYSKDGINHHIFVFQRFKVSPVGKESIKQALDRMEIGTNG